MDPLAWRFSTLQVHFLAFAHFISVIVKGRGQLMGHFNLICYTWMELWWIKSTISEHLTWVAWKKCSTLKEPGPNNYFKEFRSIEYYKNLIYYFVTYVALGNWNRNQHRLRVPIPFPVLGYWMKMKIRSFVAVDFPKMKRVKEVPNISWRRLYKFGLSLFYLTHYIANHHRFKREVIKKMDYLPNYEIQISLIHH